MQISESQGVEQIMLVLRSEKITYFWWWIWKTLHFENWSFGQDRPPDISFEISGRTCCYSSEIDLFNTIASEILLSKYLNIAPNCAHRGTFLSNMLKCFLQCDWTYFPHSGNGHFLNIAPKRVQRGIFWRCWTVFLPCQRIAPVRKCTSRRAAAGRAQLLAN